MLNASLEVLILVFHQCCTPEITLVTEMTIMLILGQVAGRGGGERVIIILKKKKLRFKGESKNLYFRRDKLQPTVSFVSHRCHHLNKTRLI